MFLLGFISGVSLTILCVSVYMFIYHSKKLNTSIQNFERTSKQTSKQTDNLYDELTALLEKDPFTDRKREVKLGEVNEADILKRH